MYVGKNVSLIWTIFSASLPNDLRLLLSCDTNQITYALRFFIVIVDFFNYV
jgi:hypothetical protein